jgi:hypothetical protein
MQRECTIHAHPARRSPRRRGLFVAFDAPTGDPSDHGSTDRADGDSDPERRRRSKPGVHPDAGADSHADLDAR